MNGLENQMMAGAFEKNTGTDMVKLIEEKEALDKEIGEMPETNLIRTSIESSEDYKKAAQMEIRYDIPGVETAIVSGDPFEVANILDSVQGDAVEGAWGTCFLTSISNICTLAGKDISEGDVVRYALENKLCNVDPWSPENTGGTTTRSAVRILNELCGIDAHAYEDREFRKFDNEAIAQAIEDGRGVIAGLDAGTLWGDPKYTDTFFGRRVANHAVTVTGAVRDADTGKVAGFFICDSGSGNACQYIDVDSFNKMCRNTRGGSVVVTDKPIRNI